MSALFGCGEDSSGRATASNQKAANGPTVLVIAVDGLDWQVLQALTGQGRCPNLAALMKQGVSSQLDTRVTRGEFLSPIIWTSCATGQRAEKHGITGWEGSHPETGEAVENLSSMRLSKALWNIVSEAGLSVNVSGWLVTWPPEPVDGVIAPEWMADRDLSAADTRIQRVAQAVAHIVHAQHRERDGQARP